MTKTGKSILLVVLALIVFVVVMVVSAGVWFFTSALQTVAADQTRATQSFADVRGRFDGSDPVLRMTDSGTVVTRQPPDTRPGRELQKVSLIAWDPDEERLATVTLPFWLLRMKDGPINLSARSAVPNVRVSLTVTELERYGPALLLDHTDGDGARVLVWTE